MSNIAAEALGHEDQSYDELPYESYTYPLTHPERMAVLAKLYGYDIPDLETARVLEIGCAGGWNILPLAHNFPDAQFVGIDLSPVQIEEANEHKKALGLTNIEFHALDLMEVSEEKFGKFDYITTHGVFSWVPDFVRDKILEIHDKQLTDNGMGCISYNVMPGWGTLGTIREMLIMHTEPFKTAEEKVQKAKDLLEFLHETMPKSKSLRNSLEFIYNHVNKSQNDSYIYHEFLEDNNNPYYFKDFAKLIGDNNLSYVGDSDYTEMYTKNMGEKAEEALKVISDPTAKEQYIDFIKNRQFRFSIIAKNSNKTAGPSLNAFKEMYYQTALEVKDDGKTNSRGEISFINPAIKSVAMNVKSPVIQAILLEICKNKSRFSFDEMVNIAKKATNIDKANIEAEILKNIIDLVFTKVSDITPYVSDTKAVYTISKKPKAYSLAQYQAKTSSDFVTTMKYSTIKLDDIETKILLLLNGELTKEDIRKNLTNELYKNKKHVLQKDGKDIKEDEFDDIIKTAIDNTLMKFKVSSLLIS